MTKTIETIDFYQKTMGLNSELSAEVVIPNMEKAIRQFEAIDNNNCPKGFQIEFVNFINLFKEMTFISKQFADPTELEMLNREETESMYLKLKKLNFDLESSISKLENFSKIK